MVYRVLTMTDRNLARIQLAALAILLEQAVDIAFRASTATPRWIAATLAVGIVVALVWKIRWYRRRYPSKV